MSTIIIIIVVAALCMMFGLILASKGTVPDLWSVVLFALGFGLGFMISWNRLISWFQMAKDKSQTLWVLIRDKLNVDSISTSFREQEVTKVNIAKTTVVVVSIIALWKFASKLFAFGVGVLIGIIAKMVTIYYGIDFSGI